MTTASTSLLAVFVERVIVEGSDIVDKYLEECKALEFDMVEIPAGSHYET